MATYFSLLKKARQSSSASQELERYFVLLAKNPEVETVDQIRDLFLNEERFAKKPLTDEQLASLALLVTEAKKLQLGDSQELESDETTSMPVSNEVSEPREQAANQVDDSAAQAGTAETNPESSAQDSAAPLSQAIEEESLAPKIGTSYLETIDREDLGRFANVELLGSGNLETIKVQITSVGVLGLEWKNDHEDGQNFCILGGYESNPLTPQTADEVWISQDSKVSIRAKSKFFTVFKFLPASVEGVKIAEGRALSDVLDFQLQAQEDRVLMRWEAREPGARVVVYKSEANDKLPETPSAVLALNIPSSATSFEDTTDIVAGRAFEYRAVLEWISPNGVTVTSGGITKSVEIPGRIPELAGFGVSLSAGNSDYVDISYSEPGHPEAKVRVFQVAGTPNQVLNMLRASGSERFALERLSSAEISDAIGDEILVEPKKSAGIWTHRAVPLASGAGTSTFVALVVLGNYFTMGAVKVWPRVGAIEPESVNLFDFFDYQLLRLDLPVGATRLQVWEQKSGTSWNQIDENSDVRYVHIDDEYRRYGGIIFADPLPGIPSKRRRLKAEPKKIFIRGVSDYDGDLHFGPEVEVDFPGRLEISHAIVFDEQQEPAAEKKPRFRFGAKKVEQSSTPASRQASLRLQSVGGVENQKFDLVLLTSPETGFILDPNQARNKRTVSVVQESSSGSDQGPVASAITASGSTKSVNSAVNDLNRHPLPPETKSFRLIPNEDEVGGKRVFVVDSAIGNFNLEARPDESRKLSIALIGAKRSGKTTYSQALLHFLENQFSDCFNSKLKPMDNDELAKLKLDQVHKFLTEGKLPPATKSARQFAAMSSVQELDDPRRGASFRIRGAGTPVGEIEIFDLAGEDMDSLDDMRLYESVLKNVDLIVFLIDPLQLPEIADPMMGEVARPDRATLPVDVLFNLADVLGPIEQRPNKNQRVAVTISKFDVLRQFFDASKSDLRGQVKNGMALTRDPSAFTNKPYNKKDGDQVDAEVTALLAALKLQNVTANIKSNQYFEADKVKFFVVSSLGHDTHTDASGISSYRISDPIRWALQDPVA